MNSESQWHAPGEPAHSGAEGEAQPDRPRLDLCEAADDLLFIVHFVTADEGPLQRNADFGRVSPWQAHTLSETLERLEVIDHFLRGRVAFFVAGKDRGYGHFEKEHELADAALDTCRAVTRVVDALLAGRVPTESEHEKMIATAAKLGSAVAELEADAG